MRHWPSLIVIVALNAVFLGLAGAHAATPGGGVTIGPAAAAPSWTNLFDRTSGWTGADGTLTVPLSGYYGPPTASTQTQWTFGDTFVGNVGPNDNHLGGWSMVHNTYAEMQGGNPGHIQFYWGTDPNGNPAPIWAPSTPTAQPGDWYWPLDGVVINGTMYQLLLREFAPQGGGFQTDGVAMVTYPANDPNPGIDGVQTDTPLFLPPVPNGRDDVDFGTSIIANTTQAGAPFPDGYIYVYGWQDDPTDQKMVVARAPASSFANFSTWTYWDGTEWNANIESVAPITNTDYVSTGYSVTPLTNGQYLLIYLTTYTSHVKYRLGSTPVGPWSNATTIWTVPELNEFPNPYAYNARAHPSLSQPGQLLISYNINSSSLYDVLQYADEYQPYFITLPVSAFK